MLHLKSWKMVQGRKSAPSGDCRTCMLETEGAILKAATGEVKPKEICFFPGPFGKNIAEES